MPRSHAARGRTTQQKRRLPPVLLQRCSGADISTVSRAHLAAPSEGVKQRVAAWEAHLLRADAPAHSPRVDGNIPRDEATHQRRVVAARLMICDCYQPRVDGSLTDQLQPRLVALVVDDNERVQPSNQGLGHKRAHHQRYLASRQQRPWLLVTMHTRVCRHQSTCMFTCNTCKRAEAAATPTSSATSSRRRRVAFVLPSA